MPDIRLEQSKGRRRRRRCRTFSLISCAFILMATMQQQQHVAATLVDTSGAASAASMTTTKESVPDYANSAKYDEAIQNYYRSRVTDDDDEPEEPTTSTTTLPTNANYFGVLAPKTSVAAESLITNHNPEEFHKATSTTQIVAAEEGFIPTSLTAAGQHFAASAAAAPTANNMAQNGYPLLLASESFKQPAGSKIDFEINAVNYDDFSGSDGNRNIALNDRNQIFTPDGSLYQHFLQQQQVQDLVERQQPQSMQELQQRQQHTMYDTFENEHQQQQLHVPNVANDASDYYNMAEMPQFGSHYLRDYQMAQYSNYQQQQQEQRQQMQSQNAAYGNEMLLTTPPATIMNLRTKSNYAINVNGKQRHEEQQQQQQQQKSKVDSSANRQQKRQQFSTLKQQQQTAEPSQLQIQVTDSAGRTMMPQSQRVNVADDIDMNDIDGITRHHHHHHHEQNSDTPQFQSYYNNQQQQQQQQQQQEQQQMHNSLHSMHQQLEKQRQQFAQLQLQLQHQDQLVQQQQQQLEQQEQLQMQHQQQQQEQLQQHQNLLSSTYEATTSNSDHKIQLPPITSTVHHSPASAAAVAGIPLGKHVQVTKRIPTLAHYQQTHIPFKQTYPIEIPRPIITTVPRPYPIHIPITKTVAVPKLKEVKIPIERIKPYPVERNIPYLVERRVPYRVEKQVATPYYYPFPIKVPVVKTIVHRLPHKYHFQPHVGLGGGHNSNANSIFSGDHLH